MVWCKPQIVVYVKLTSRDPIIMVNISVEDNLRIKEAETELQKGIEEGLHGGGGVGDMLVRYCKGIAAVDTGEFKRSIDHAKIQWNQLAFGSSDKPGKVFALEDGWSSQSPSGHFEPSVKRNVDRIISIMKKSVNR
jgi:hypothetical protein